MAEICIFPATHEVQCKEIQRNPEEGACWQVSQDADSTRRDPINSKKVFSSIPHRQRQNQRHNEETLF